MRVLKESIDFLQGRGTVIAVAHQVAADGRARPSNASRTMHVHFLLLRNGRINGIQDFHHAGRGRNVKVGYGKPMVFHRHAAVTPQFLYHSRIVWLLALFRQVDKDGNARVQVVIQLAPRRFGAALTSIR